MKVIAVLLVLFAAVVPANALFGKEYFINIIGKFECHGKPVVAGIEIMEEDASEYTHDLLGTAVVEFLNITVSGSDPFLLSMDDHLEVFLRVHYDCGCGPVFDTVTSPPEKQFLTEAEAVKHPWLIGKIELSDCEARRVIV